MAANLALTTSGVVRVVESIKQITLPAGEAIAAGDAVRLDVSTGKITGANATGAAEARILGIATTTAAAGMPVTVLRNGVLDGFALGDLAYDAPVHLSDTDKTLADTAGSTAAIVGRVIPAHAQATGAALDKLLLVELG